MNKGWVSKLVARYRADGDIALEPRSRAPKASPHATPAATVEPALRLHKQLSKVSYLRGTEVVGNGSRRPDIVLGSNVLQPLAIIDLKTGATGIQGSWIAQLRANLPTRYENVPIIEMRP